MISEETAGIEKRSVRASDIQAGLRSISMAWLLPGLLIGGTLNQQTWSGTLLIFGRISSASAMLAAAIIIWTSSREKIWPLAVFACILTSRVLRIMMPGSSGYVLLYTVFLALLFCYAGSVIALQKPRLISRQVMFLCLLSVPLMILQLAGAGEWTQILRTDYHGDETILQYPTLFLDEVHITTLQARPAGFFWANNFLSIMIMFGLGLHYGRSETDKLAWQDFALCSIAVLSMAKIVFLTLFIIAGWRLFMGRKLQRLKIAKGVVLLASMLIVYAVFFPGIFAYNTSLDLLGRNFHGRYNDLASTTRSEIPGPVNTVDEETVGKKEHFDLRSEMRFTSLVNDVKKRLEVPETIRVVSQRAPEAGAAMQEKPEVAGTIDVVTQKTEASVAESTVIKGPGGSETTDVVSQGPPGAGVAMKETPEAPEMISSAADKPAAPEAIRRAGHESGYASLVENSLPYFMIALLFLVPVYVKGFKQLKNQFAELTGTTVSTLIVVTLIPLITPFIEGAVFWFIAGFAFLPVLLNARLICVDDASPDGDDAVRKETG